MVAPDKHDGLKVLRSMIVLLLLVMFFDGLRAVAKIPGGIAPQREFEVKPKNTNLNAEAKDELAFKVVSYVGHNAITFRVPAKQFDLDHGRTGASHIDISLDYNSPLNHSINSFLERGNATDTFSFSGDCHDIAKPLYHMEVTMVGFYFFSAAMTVLFLAYILYQQEMRKKQGVEVFHTFTGFLIKLSVLLIAVYVLLKIPRISMEAVTFGPKDKCFNEAFETRGMYLMDNYLNMEKLNSEFEYTNQGNQKIGEKMTITSSKPAYTMINHAVTMDSLFLGFFVLFALTKTFNPIGSLLYYTFADPMQKIPIQIDYTSAEKSAQSAMLESLIHD
tara:strand:+ start:2194 stop:3192 length:999 start_codon:yes stop_codon:yes gene_type:complete